MSESKASQAKQKLCPKCGRERDEHFFFKFPECIFCRIDRAEKTLSGLQTMLNFNPPNGKAMKQLCKRCKELNWWVNLTTSGHCHPCRDEIRDVIGIKPEGVRKELETQLDDVLEAMIANMEM